jgi:hypothetical protein
VNLGLRQPGCSAWLSRGSGVVAIALCCTITGCKKKEMRIDPPTKIETAPARHDVLAAHNERVRKLATTNSVGVIELRWSDERGKHFEQGDLELWQTTNDRTALDISKIGERLLWMGSNAEQWWLFDLMTKGDHVAYVGRHDEMGNGFGALGVRPLALLDLLGLSPIDAARDAEKPLVFDESIRAWTLRTTGRGGELRIAFDAVTYLPKRIELLDASGLVVAQSTLTRYASVDVPGLAIMARPKMPLTIDIHRAATGEAAIAGDAKIALNETVGRIEPKQEASVFNLERLLAAMKPSRIERGGQVSESP